MKTNKKNIVIGIIVLAVFFVVIALFNSTYALFSNDAYGNNLNSYSTGLLSIVIDSKTENLSLTDVLPMSDEDGLETTPYVFTLKNVGNLDYKFNVKLLSTGDSSNTFQSQYIKLQIDGGNVTTLSSLSSGIIKSNVVLAAGESKDVSVRLWLSEDTPNSELGKGFNSKIVVDGQAVYTTSNNKYNDNETLNGTLIEHIKNLYKDNYDSTYNTAFEDGSGMNYYAPSVRLMNDGLDSSGNMVSSEAAANGTAGNIRYYGADDTNLKNYIYFNCSDYNSQSDSTCEKWRIVGIVDGKVKIMKNEVLGAYPWDKKYIDDIGDVDWNTASLNTLLNSAYYNSGEFLLYYYDEYIGENQSRIESFSENGITSITRNKNLIVSSIWYTNMITGFGKYASMLYKGERTGNNIWNGNIALLYPSDYGYAADLNNCKYPTSDYYMCVDYNWINNVFGGWNNVWMLTIDSDMGEAFVGAGSISSIGNSNSWPWDVIPSLYLNPELDIDLTGDGSSSNPYRLIVK